MRRLTQKTGVLLLALALAATLLAGCAAPWPFPQPTPDPKLPDSQQIFRPQEIGPASGDLETLDPALIEFQTDYDNAQLLFPPLVTLDEQGRPTDWAAERHEISADGLTYTFHLRSGMTWSDGTPIDATTFAYSINRALDPCTGAPNASYLYAITGAETFNKSLCRQTHSNPSSSIGSAYFIPDPLTLQIKLERPTGYFLAALTYPVSWAVPKALIERYTVQSDDAYSLTKTTWTEHLADNGGFGGNLYRLTKWDHAGHVEFERNERFWGKKPLLRRIEYMLYKSTDTAWVDFAAGKGDTSQPPFAELDAAKRLKGVNLQYAPQFHPSYLQVNGNLAPFDDVRVRQAFSLAIDRQAIAHDVFHDTVQPTIHLIPEGMAGYNPALADAAGRIGAGALTTDLDAARTLATAYAADKCGGGFANCPPVTVVLGSRSLLGQTFISAIKSGWEQAFPGWTININSRGRCGAQIVQYCIPSPQLLSGGWLFAYPDPHDFLSQVWTTGGPYNQTDNAGYSAIRFSIPQVDALCAQAEAATDRATRLQMYQQAEQLLVAQGLAIPLYQNETITAVRSRVVNWRMGPLEMTPLSVWQATYIKR